MPKAVSAARARRPRNSLTVEEILDVAEAVAAGGIEALTIRAVANELESSPMALYRYFGTKDELVDALLNRVLGRMEPPLESASWIDDLGAFARNHREMLSLHQWAVTALFARPAPGPNALPIGEWALRILERGGIEGDEAVAIFSGIIGLNYGWASFVVARAGGAGDSLAEDLVSPGVAEAFPLTASVAVPMSRYGSVEHYDLVLGYLLAGVLSTSAPPEPGK
ncbi:TetR/AcrR family transcriptional regulator [Paenarthrobacter sp. NPDC056912]|uniref:TetR/AcrR family transcriptional regulator n=1 Tax=Paenarthrobacter sp. NPDC056912 TaxID=3345965 RepID=UPI00366C97A3